MARAQRPAPAHYYGGQAVIEGVMMRGAKTWAVAVRRADGDIWLERHPVSDVPQRYPLLRKPLLRGTFALVDALAIGMKALTISANQSAPEEEQLDGKQMGASMAVALLVFVGFFVVLPNVGLAWAGGGLGDGLVYHLVEGVVRIGLFLAYLGGISLLPEIRRVFAYHGAEHATIAAWEHDDALTPEAVSRYSTLHVRCGTNFLLLVMLLAIVLFTIGGALVPAPDGGVLTRAAYHIGLRIVLLPLVSGLAYEALRLGAAKDNIVVRTLMKPGLWLQKITTKPFTPDMAEVAIRSFGAVVPTADFAGRTEAALPTALVWGPGADSQELPGGPYGPPADVTGEPIPRPGEAPA